GSWRLVHLPINQCGLINNAGFLHFQPEIVAFTGSFADAAEDGITAMFHGDVIDQFHENNGLANSSAPAQADLSAARIRSEEVDNLDTGFEGLDFGFLIDEFRSGTVNRIGFFFVDWPLFIHRLADHIEHAAQRFRTHRDGDACTSVHRIHTAHQSFGRIHGDATHCVFTQMLRDFDNEIPLLIADRRIAYLKCVVDGRQRAVGKLDVNDRAQHLGNLPHVHKTLSSVYFLTSRLPPYRRSPSAHA